MIGDIILWFKRVMREMFCVHEYEWRNLTYEERNLPHNRDIWAKLVCKKCGRGDDYY